VFFPRRLALLAVLVQILPLLLIAWGFVSGRLQLDFDANAFTREPAAWLGILVGLFTILMLIQFIGVYNASIRRLLAIVRAQRDVIARQALHDALTGLPSLQLARDRLTQAIVQAQRERRMAALLFIDLDDFKAANDQYGHDCGDAVLRTVATRLLATVRRTDTPARLGGDEFVVILNGIENAEAARHVAAQIVDSLAQPVIWQQHSLNVGASVGIALFPEHGDSAEALLRHADQAMYAVKRAGKASFAMYVPRRDKTVVEAS
jgi:diguanylate cyclase (GGDEF)-like protein